MEANIVVGTTYYVRNVVSSNTFTVSSTSGGANVDLAGNASPTAAMFANPTSYLYVCTASYNATANSISVANASSTGDLLTVSNTGSLTLNDPIIFTGANVTQANLVANTIYYVKAIASSGANGTISVSATRTTGTAGANVTLTTTANGFSAVTYNGTDIWKRIALTSW
jgi:hypothetical protein